MTNPQDIQFPGAVHVPIEEHPDYGRFQASTPNAKESRAENLLRWAASFEEALTIVCESTKPKILEVIHLLRTEAQCLMLLAKGER